jgi:membrane-associated protease RseP (regulator of RpoE activity)
MDGLLIALIILLAYIVLVYVLNSKGILQKHNMNAWGPFIMWRTERGRNLIDWLARPKRFWKAYAAVGKVVVIAVMVFMMALLIWEAFLVPSIPADRAPSPQMLLGIPGLNPVIPIWYGILGLVVGIVIHEFGHGILARVGEMKVKALGVVLLVVPMGAFVEPDEEQLVKAEKKRRTSVYTAGPATNVIFALICAFLFSTVMVSSVDAVRDNPIVVNMADNTPASHAGLQFGDQIVTVNGTAVMDYSSIAAPAPGTSVTIQYYRGSELRTAEVVSGVVLTTIASGLPAEQAGLRTGMIIVSLNNMTVANEADLKAALASIAPGQTVPLSALVYDSASQTYKDAGLTTITPISKKAYYESTYGQTTDDIAYIGVNSAYLGAATNDPQVLVDRMANPYAGLSGFGGFISGTLSYIALPFTGLQPMQGPVSELFVPGGIFSGMSIGTFWILANSVYWLFWLSLMLGMTNALPAVPLDGGYLFKDWLDTIVGKIKRSASQEQRERYVSSITWTLAILVLFLIMWQLIGPRLL